MQTENLSKKLRNLREVSGFSQGQIANKLYITRAAYNHYETGKRTPTIENMLQLSKIYNINPLELIKLSLPANSNISIEVSDIYQSTQSEKSANEITEFIKNFNNLGSYDRELIISITNLLSKKHIY